MTEHPKGAPRGATRPQGAGETATAVGKSSSRTDGDSSDALSPSGAGAGVKRSIQKGAPVKRCLRIYEILVKHVADGMSNKEIADATRTTAVQAWRDLELLESLGWVEKKENGRWFLTTKPLALFVAYEAAFHEMLARAEEIRTNLNAAAKRYGG